MGLGCSGPISCRPYDEEALIAQRVLGHGEGQQHAIDDVNAGRVDDLIQPRLQACPPYVELAQDRAPAAKPEVGQGRAAHSTTPLVQACPPPSEAPIGQRVQDLESEIEEMRVKALWDADYAKGDIEQAHAKTIAMFGSTMARQAADYMAECLLAVKASPPEETPCPDCPGTPGRRWLGEMEFRCASCKGTGIQT
jgi:hypothetical protein